MQTSPEGLYVHANFFLVLLDTISRQKPATVRLLQLQLQLLPLPATWHSLQAALFMPAQLVLFFSSSCCSSTDTKVVDKH